MADKINKTDERNFKYQKMGQQIRLFRYRNSNVNNLAYSIYLRSISKLSTMPLTNRQQLERLKSPYREQAFRKVNNSPNTDWLNYKSLCLADSVIQSITFGDERIQKQYWLDICQNPQNYLQE